MTTQFDDPAPPPTTHPPSRPARSRGLFRAFWRWHFYASFLVVPVLLLLAVTGLIYLFRFQFEPLLHADLMKVQAPDGVIAQPYAAQQAAVERAYPEASIMSMTEPADAGRSTVFATVHADGSTRDIYVNPYGAEVLGDLNPDTTVSGIAVRLHGELMAGKAGDYVIELGACWAIVMALTGYYLFVKGRAARLRRRLSGAAGATLRSRHALVGSVVGVSLLFLLVSGLPWTGFWGAKVQELATQQGSSLWSTDPGALSDPTSSLDESLPHSHAVDVPWALGDSDVPTSTPPVDGERSVANVDTALEVASDEGLSHPMTVAIPDGEQGVYSVIGYAFHDPTAERTVHVDQFGGQAVSTYGYDDYPALAKVVSQGIGVHEGRSFGVVNFWAAALACLAVVFMCVSGPLMWWRRRPARRAGVPASIGAPRGRLPLAATPALLVALVVLGLFLPLFGISVLAVLVLDQVLLRRVPAFRTWFDIA
ncbi:PepSY-associated TM helix domain-containing protein [Nocardioides sp.]|uniref:PepSY-associated TM helix domain-containing protein n=1 Tax=Nocardioides sp. TaxID=35761 RepID=UPI003D0C980C